MKTRERKTNSTVTLSQIITAHEAGGVEIDSTDAQKVSCLNDLVIIDVTTVNDNPKQSKVSPDNKSDKRNNALVNHQLKMHTTLIVLSVLKNGLTPTAISKIKSWKCPYCYRCPFLKNKNGDKMTTTLETLFERLQSIEKCNDRV